MLFLVCAVISAALVVGAGVPPVLLVVPAAALLLLVASVAKLRGAARKIDAVFAEELSTPQAREIAAEIGVPAEIS
jgi:hypothetical protein